MNQKKYTHVIVQLMTHLNNMTYTSYHLYASVCFLQSIKAPNTSVLTASILSSPAWTGWRKTVGNKDAACIRRFTKRESILGVARLQHTPRGEKKWQGTKIFSTIMPFDTVGSIGSCSEGQLTRPTTNLLYKLIKRYSFWLQVTFCKLLSVKSIPCKPQNDVQRQEKRFYKKRLHLR